MTHKTIVSVVLGLMLGVVAPPDVAARNNARLKPGAKGKICRSCHGAFLNVLKKKSVHTPLRKGDCTGCHSPHAAAHGKLLKEDVKQVCQGCHTVLEDAHVSKHRPVVSQACTKCHDAHASDHRGNLIKPEAELCGACHGDLVATAKTAKYGHSPLLSKGCTACHDAHGAKNEHLLKKSEQVLCAGCHRIKSKAMASRHLNFPISKARCTGCHSPHGSNQRGMLNENAHAPLRKKMCTQCHQGLTSKKPLALKAAGAELCRPCHASAVKKMINSDHVHAAMLDTRACLNCHTPHASRAPKLLRADQRTTCGACHADTIARYDRSPTKHKPVKKDCVKCHEPHGSSNLLLLKKADMLSACGTCHQWGKHAAHKVGPRYRDPRNPNLGLDCLSCHLAHGSEYKGMIPFVTTSALCTQCHKNFGR